MTVPESQLLVWSKQGATAPATALYERIRNTLSNDAVLREHDFEVFLQGSYRNSTNIHGESDVDVVAKLRQTYKPDYSHLDSFTRIEEDSARSFAVECLVYNVPSQLFGVSYQNTFTRTVDWLSSADLGPFVCQNGVQRLFRPGGWSEDQARSFINGLIHMWQRWGHDARLRV